MAYQSFQVTGPYEGIVDNLPAPNKPPSALDDMLNFVSRKGRLQTRPRLNDFGAPPDGALVRNMLTFEDIVGSFHTLVLTTQHAYFLNNGGDYNELTLPMGITDLSGTGKPFSLCNVLNRVYFSNGSNLLLYTDGSDTVQVAGDVPAAARYMCVLAAHLLLGYTTEPEPGATGSTEQTFRIRWSTSGDPNDWTSFGSGFEDVLEVPDRITGLVTLGRNSYLFRKNGVSIISPTGDGLAPFAIENLSISPKGVGSIYPYGLAIYANYCAFIASNEIYQFNGVEFTPIGGKAKKKIFEDLANASGDDEVVAFIVPNFGLSYDYLSYWISIPGVNVAWVFSFDDQAWTRFTFLGDGYATFVGNVATG